MYVCMHVCIYMLHISENKTKTIDIWGQPEQAVKYQLLPWKRMVHDIRMSCYGDENIFF
jgi:hypothetical protein